MYTRIKYGVEYSPERKEPGANGTPLLVLVLVVLMAGVGGGWMLWRAHHRRMAEDPQVTAMIAPTPAADAQAVAPPQALPADEGSLAALARREIQSGSRPVKVNNLLLRLSDAENAQNVEMAIGTIEQLRLLPGAADLDDVLARRLGVLNMRRLFVLKSPQWTRRVVVKRAETAERIAYEHGSTYASLVKLNGDITGNVKKGTALIVMHHPRFSLVITARTRTADLALNGKFFKRYYLLGGVRGRSGPYVAPERFRDFCAEQGVSFRPLDRAELEMLLPAGASITLRDL